MKRNFFNILLVLAMAIAMLLATASMTATAATAATENTTAQKAVQAIGHTAEHIRVSAERLALGEFIELDPQGEDFLTVYRAEVQRLSRASDPFEGHQDLILDALKTWGHSRDGYEFFKEGQVWGLAYLNPLRPPVLDIYPVVFTWKGEYYVASSTQYGLVDLTTEYRQNREIDFVNPGYLHTDDAYPVYQDPEFAIEFDSETGVVSRVEFGNPVWSVEIPKDSTYVGDCTYGYIFLNQRNLYAVRDGEAAKIAKGVRYVVSTKYWLTSDTGPVTLYVDRKGDLIAFHSWDWKSFKDPIPKDAYHDVTKGRQGGVDSY